MNQFELLEKLKNLESITYLNGSNFDRIHPGLILAQYIELNVGTKAYQEFNILLNDCLTLTGCRELLKINEFKKYYVFYEELKPYFDEAIILKEFESFVEVIEIELSSIVNGKTHLVNAVIAQIINNTTSTDSRFKSINKDKTETFIKELVLAKLNLDSKTAATLAHFDIQGSRRDVLEQQVSNTMLAHLESLF